MKKPKKSIFFKIYFVFVLFFMGIYTIFASIIQLFLSIILMFTPDLRADTIWKIGRVAPRILLNMLGCRIKVEGFENIPNYNPRTQSGKFCIMANHTSILDIAAICTACKVRVGFIAKKSLKYIPIMNVYMKAIHCVFIDRKSIRSNIDAINGGVKNLNKNIPMLIFPEGHRSKTGEVGKFLEGSSKLALRSTAPIAPLAITGLRCYLEDRTKLRRPKVKPIIKFLPPVWTASLEAEERKNLSHNLEVMIKDEIQHIKRRYPEQIRIDF